MKDTPASACEADYIYKNTKTSDLELTFLPPENKKSEKAPVVFLIPGGGWHHEKRASMLEFLPKTVDSLRKNGFAIVTIDYRTYNKDKAKMSEIMEDCFDALKFIINHSDTLRIDRNKIITCGHSAGAHLALMLAYTDGNRYNVNLNKEDYKISSVVALSPVAILYDLKKYHWLGDIVDVFETEKLEEQLKAASPIEYVDSNCPPTFAVAGVEDNFVNYISSKLLYEKLVARGVVSELLLIEGGGHIYEKKKDIEPSLSIEEIQSRIYDFITEFNSVEE